MLPAMPNEKLVDAKPFARRLQKPMPAVDTLIQGDSHVFTIPPVLANRFVTEAC
jgi:hypothetical protein